MPKFIHNQLPVHHASTLVDLFNGATHIDWWLAFASYSGCQLIITKLRDFLDQGNTARVVVGLDMYNTEPQALQLFQQFAKDVPLQFEFLLSNSAGRSIFHPKLYYFRYEPHRRPKQVKILLGSANLTSGGLQTNVEWSTLLNFPINRNADNTFLTNFHNLCETLIEEERVIPATDELIEKYRLKFELHKLHRAIAAKRAKASIIQSATDPYEYFRVLLLEMRGLTQPDDFDSQVQNRKNSRSKALEILNRLIDQPPQSQQEFLTIYKYLVSPPTHYWHSSLINIQQQSVAQDYANFIDGLAKFRNRFVNEQLSASTAYKALLQVYQLDRNMPNSGVHGVGPNVISEILHTFDNERYAVLNKNSSTGLSRVCSLSSPLNLSKDSVTPEFYGNFCSAANEACKALNLNNLSELDALMNFDFFR